MLSNVEYKLLTVLFCLTILICLIKTGDLVIKEHNRAVEAAEFEKKRVALGEDKISFSGCSGDCSPSVFEIILPYQLLLLLVSFGLFLVRRPATLLISFLVLSLNLYAYFEWMRFTHRSGTSSEFTNLFATPLTSYFLIGSTTLDFISIGLIFSVCVLQFGLMSRFGAERMRAKLVSNDQTPRP